MDYPDENEEFELQYQEELDMLDELPPDPYDNYVPITNAPPKVLNNMSTQVKTDPGANLNTVHGLESPALSQISYGQDDSQVGLGLGGTVNRRLFSTPKGPLRGCSTPLTTKHPLTPIQEVVGLPKITEEPVAKTALEELQLQGIQARNKRRLERDLFGDIDDLFFHETYEDPLAKKARTEEERDLEMIEKIIAARRKTRENNNTHRKDQLSRLQALHDYKMKNLSHVVPKWPALPIRRSNDTRLYVRFHSDDYEEQALQQIHALPQYSGLLGANNERVWAEANEIVLRRTSVAATPTPQQQQSEQVNTETGEMQSKADEKLWVEKYKPRKYIDLLSDESTNRSLLYWLKMWDKVVFGKEFKRKEDENSSNELNSFNKRTGKFESNGGWRNRKQKQTLNTNVDDLGRPMQKVALLCGPPGLGKTTLAHTIARHAGYAVREINASDDRSPGAFKTALENGTQMTSVLNEDSRPNCIILDEIDGAPRQSIEFLVKFVTDAFVAKAPRKGSKGERNILKRPIICICNDMYDPALRPLRQIAFVVTFPPIDSARLAERLLQISRRERLKADFGSLIALADKSGNDVRSCISTMQFFNAQKKALTLQDVLNNSLGQKDRHQGLFDIWGAIFRIQRPRKQLQTMENSTEETHVTMTDMSVTTRVRNVLDAVHAGDDYERLLQGVHENYLHQKMPDPNMYGIVEACQWFCFSDSLQHQISQLQNYTIYPYLRFGFVVWHLNFASLAWPKINFPTRGYEVHQKTVTQRHIFQALRRGISCSVMGVGQGSFILTETVPLLKRILSPQLRSVAVQLLSPKEKYDLQHTIDIMVDLGLTYTQLKTAEGPYVFQMEPDLDTLAQFPGCPGISLNYFSRQLIAREVELERVRRATPKAQQTNASGNASKHKATAAVPNHLQRLQPKRLNKNANGSTAKDMVSKDFFGRITYKAAPAQRGEDPKSDPIVKSSIWYRYKEGFNNAVRRDLHLKDLL